jgi:hypothetical protein
MHITITEQEYQELMRVKREHEVLRNKINTRIGQLKEGRKDSRLSESEKLTMTIFIEMLQELLA